MSYLNPIRLENAPQAVRDMFAEEARQFGTVSNSQRTLLHSLTAFRAYQGWNALWEEVEALLGTRGAVIYGHTISSANECQLCTAHFRRALAELGLSADDLEVTGEEELLVRLGQAAARHWEPTHSALWAPLRQRYTERDLVNLIAFAGLMVATNLFNNLVQVKVDDTLAAFQAPERVLVPAFAWETL